MTNWWQIAFSGACIVALAMLALGLWIGYRAGQDRAADAETAARFDAVPGPGRHRVAAPRMLPAAPKAATGSTAEMFARLEAEVSRPPAPVRALTPIGYLMTPDGPEAQLPLGQLVNPAREHHPGRATDFITAMHAETDRFIAQMGAGR